MAASATHRADGRLRFPDGAVFLSLVCLAILLASLALPAQGFPGIDTCAFHALTGLSCPGCGLTRAFCAISRGEFLDAWRLHPFSFPLYAGVLLGLAAPFLDRRFPALAGGAWAKAFRTGVLAMAVAMLIFGAWRARGQSSAAHAPSGSRGLRAAP